MTIPVESSTLTFPFLQPPSPGSVIEVAPGVLWTLIPLPYRLDHVNIYFVEDEGGWAIIDSGINTSEAIAVWDALLSGPFAGASFTKLIVTHSHPDHIGLAGWLCKRLNIPLLISQTAYLECINISLSPDAMDNEEHHAFYRRNGMDEATIAQVSTRGHEYLKKVHPLPRTFVRLVSGDVLTIGRRQFAVMTCDGHAPEQVMLYCERDRLMFVADQVLEKITPNISVWAKEPFGDPLGLYIRSLMLLQEHIPADVLALPGHRLPFRGLPMRAGELMRHHESRCDLIEVACSGVPRRVMDLVPVLFRRELDSHQLGFAFNETLAHVNYLQRKQVLRAETVNEATTHYVSARPVSGARPQAGGV